MVPDYDPLSLFYLHARYSDVIPIPKMPCTFDIYDSHQPSSQYLDLMASCV